MTAPICAIIDESTLIPGTTAAYCCTLTRPPDHVREARWLLRSLRQRARTYEKIVAAIALQQPKLAIAMGPRDVVPVPIRSIAEAVGMHESTISRVAAACRIQNIHGVFALAVAKRKIGLA